MKKYGYHASPSLLRPRQAYGVGILTTGFALKVFGYLLEKIVQSRSLSSGELRISLTRIAPMWYSIITTQSIHFHAYHAPLLTLFLFDVDQP